MVLRSHREGRNPGLWNKMLDALFNWKLVQDMRENMCGCRQGALLSIAFYVVPGQRCRWEGHSLVGRTNPYPWGQLLCPCPVRVTKVLHYHISTPWRRFLRFPVHTQASLPAHILSPISLGLCLRLLVCEPPGVLLYVPCHRWQGSDTSHEAKAWTLV